MFLFKKKKSKKSMKETSKKIIIKLPNINNVSKNFANNIFNEINKTNIPYDKMDELIDEMCASLH